MLRLLIVACVFAAVFCQPKPCCTPDKWEGLQAGQGGTVINGKPEIYAIVSYVAFDRNDKKIFAFSNTTIGLKTISQKVYQDYDKEVQYVLDVMTGACVKSAITTPFNNGCVPKDAKFMGKFTMGLGKESLNAKSYSIHMEDQSGSVLDASLTVTEDLCVPIGENVVGSQNKVPLAITYGFVNITPGIKNPSIFNPPPACMKNATKAEFVPQVHHHRHVLF